MAGDQRLGRVGQFQRDLLVLQPSDQPLQLNLDDVFQLLVVQPVEDDDFIDPIQEFRPEMLPQRIQDQAASVLRTTPPP